MMMLVVMMMMQTAVNADSDVPTSPADHVEVIVLVSFHSHFY